MPPKTKTCCAQKGHPSVTPLAYELKYYLATLFLKVTQGANIYYGTKGSVRPQQKTRPQQLALSKHLRMAQVMIFYLTPQNSKVERARRWVRPNIQTPIRTGTKPPFWAATDVRDVRAYLSPRKLKPKSHGLRQHKYPQA